MEHRQIGWDGLRFRVPALWQAAVIRDGYLLFEEDSRPVFGLRWQPVPEGLSPRDLVRRLQRRGEAKNIRIRLQDGPVGSFPLPDHLAGHGFSWQQGEEGGKGLLLLSSRSRRASLLQFHRPLSPLETSDLLRSFQDHGGEETPQLWAMYDIRCLLPARARLARSRFLLGRYTLAFDLDGLEIVLHRFRPAAELLAGSSLELFGQRVLGMRSQWLLRKEADCCEWEKAATRMERFLGRLQKGKRAARRLRLWRPAGENGLLAVGLECNTQIDGRLFEELCASYGFA